MAFGDEQVLAFVLQQHGTGSVARTGRRAIAAEKGTNCGEKGSKAQAACQEPLSSRRYLSVGTAGLWTEGPFAGHSFPRPFALLPVHRTAPTAPALLATALAPQQVHNGTRTCTQHAQRAQLRR